MTTVRDASMGRHVTSSLLVAALQGDYEGAQVVAECVNADEPARYALRLLSGIASELIAHDAEARGVPLADVVESFRADLLAAAAHRTT